MIYRKQELMNYGKNILVRFVQFSIYDLFCLSLLEEISFQNFQDILKAEKPIDTRALEEAFEKLYKDRKSDWSEVDFERLRIDLLEVDFIILPMIHQYTCFSF